MNADSILRMINKRQTAQMLLIIWTLNILAITAYDGKTFQPKSKGTAEPLLRFPFIHSLANPCDFQFDVFDSRGHEDESFKRDLPRKGEMSLDQQVLDFLAPFRHLIELQSAEPSPSKDTNITDDQLKKELKLVVSQALQLINYLYSPSALRTKCNGYQLMSLPREHFFSESPTGEIQLEELYRSLMIIAAHLYVMVRDVYDSARLCPSESVVHLQLMKQLIGKVKTSMCLMLQSAVLLTDEREENADYFRVTHEVLQSIFHRYHYCSTREIRECLVIIYTNAIFDFVHAYIAE